MKYILFILVVLIIFMSGYALFIFLVELQLRRKYRNKVDKKIKEAMFNELGFTYRETTKGKGFLIIDEYKKNKAIPV